MSDALDRLINGQSRPVVPVRTAAIDGTQAPVPEIPETIETKQFSIRLEQGVYDRIMERCRGDFSRDVLLEAVFEVAENHPELWQEVVSLATEKHTHRQRLGNQKRARTMMQKFG